MSEADAVNDAVLEGVRHLRLVYPTRVMIMLDGKLARFNEPVTMEHAESLIQAQALHVISLEDHRHVMLVDDQGVGKGLPVNVLATRHYHAKCGGVVPWQIRGHVIIVPESDFPKDDELGGLYD